MTDRHLDEAAEVIRQLADSQAPEPLSEAELERLLGGLPDVAPPRPRRWLWAAAAAVLAIHAQPQGLGQARHRGAPVVGALAEVLNVHVNAITVAVGETLEGMHSLSHIGIDQHLVGRLAVAGIRVEIVN